MMGYRVLHHDDGHGAWGLRLTPVQSVAGVSLYRHTDAPKGPASKRTDITPGLLRLKFRL